MVATKVEQEIISEDDFKSLFKLHQDCVIPENTLIQYTKYVQGSYLLYKEICNIRERKFSVHFKNEEVQLYACYEPYGGMAFQEFIDPLGSRSKLTTGFYDTPTQTKPFWTYTRFNDDSRIVKNLAYSQLMNELNNINGKYYTLYSITLDFRDITEKHRNHPNDAIWLDGVLFNNKLYVIDQNGNSKFIETGRIPQTITNRSGIWIGDMLEPIKKLIKLVK